MNIIETVFNWFVMSSKNPEKFALTLKAGVPFLVLFGIGDEVVFGGAIDAVTHFVILTATWATGLTTTYGALRKVYNTIFPKRLT